MWHVPNAGFCHVPVANICPIASHWLKDSDEISSYDQNSGEVKLKMMQNKQNSDGHTNGICPDS